MPTTRARHMIAETDEVARAIDEAARRWPEAGGARGRLLLLLIEAGAMREISGRRAACTAAFVRRAQCLHCVPCRMRI